MYGCPRNGFLGFQLAYFSSQEILGFLGRIFLIKPQLNEFCLGLKIADTEEQLEQEHQRPRDKAFEKLPTKLVFNFEN